MSLIWLELYNKRPIVDIDKDCLVTLNTLERRKRWVMHQRFPCVCSKDSFYVQKADVHQWQWSIPAGITTSNVMELYCLNDLLFMEGHLVSVNNCDRPFLCLFLFSFQFEETRPEDVLPDNYQVMTIFEIKLISVSTAIIIFFGFYPVRYN